MEVFLKKQSYRNWHQPRARFAVTLSAERMFVPTTMKLPEDHNVQSNVNYNICYGRIYFALIF